MQIVKPIETMTDNLSTNNFNHTPVNTNSRISICIHLKDIFYMFIG